MTIYDQLMAVRVAALSEQPIPRAQWRMSPYDWMNCRAQLAPNDTGGFRRENGDDLTLFGTPVILDDRLPDGEFHFEPYDARGHA